MKFDLNVLSELFYKEMLRLKAEVERLEMQKAASLERQKMSSPVEKLLVPETMFEPTKNLRSDEP